jgi:outer membrane protein TolC
VKTKFFAGLLLTASSALAFAQETDRFDLEGFYALALEKSGRIAESSGQLKVSEARGDQARGASMPIVQLEAIAGPSPTLSGDALRSETDWTKWGVAFQNKIEVIQPLYAFGALAKLREAAQAAQEAELGRHEREKSLLKQDVAKLYYGYQLAFELREICRDLLDQMTKAREEGERMRARKTKGAPTATDIDRLNMIVAELTARFEEAQKFMDLARLGMAVETGLYGKSEARWRRANLSRRETELKDLDFYKQISVAKRPEYQALRKEIEARELLADAEAGRSYPTLFAGARWTFAASNVSPDLPSVFAHDPYNEDTFVAGLGVRWNIFSADARAKAAQARAEAIKTRAKNEVLLNSLGAELEKNWTELRFLKVSAEQKGLATQAARRVYLDMVGGFSLGTRSAKDLLEAIGALAMAQKASLEAVMEEQLAWVRLESSVGQAL